MEKQATVLRVLRTREPIQDGYWSTATLSNPGGGVIKGFFLIPCIYPFRLILPSFDLVKEFFFFSINSISVKMVKTLKKLRNLNNCIKGKFKGSLTKKIENNVRMKISDDSQKIRVFAPVQDSKFKLVREQNEQKS